MLSVAVGRRYAILLGDFDTSLTAGVFPTYVIRSRIRGVGELQVLGRSKTHALMPQLTFAL